MSLLVLACILSGCTKSARMPTTPVKYQINIKKQGGVVKAAYDLNLPVGGTTLLKDFKLYVERKNLISDFKAGQSTFNSTVSYQLTNPDQDVTVGFAIVTNEGWRASSYGVLRGAKEYDEIAFSN